MLAAIDIGTNSVLLVIAERAGSTVVPVLERATITRLGQGVDRTRHLADDAAARTLDCLRDYAVELERRSVRQLAVVGTSALRDAQGATAFLDEAERLLGQRPRIISGDEEAELSFRGALSGLGIGGHVAVLDVGGGSTELISGSASPCRVEQRVSVDIGSVRLHERHVRSDPPSARELANVEHDIARALQSAPLPSADQPLIGVAGTVTTLQAMALRLDSYDPGVIHGSKLTRQVVEDVCALLSGSTVEQRRALAGLEPQRADVILAGALIVRTVLRRSGLSELVVSDRGLRFGLLERLHAENTG